MNLDPYIQSVRHQLEVAGEVGGEDGRGVAERLVAPLEAAIRLAMQDALVAAAEQITVELAPGSVELRLRGREPEFVVLLPPVDPSVQEPAMGDDVSSHWAATGSPPGGTGGEGAAVSRINLRLPDHLKARIEQAADGEALSVNAWLVRAAAAALERKEQTRRREERAPGGAQRYTGWSR